MIFTRPTPYFCWKHQQKISKTALRSIEQTFPLLNWQKMPRMHHGVSLLNDAKIREEASVWSAGLCGFYFSGFSRQNIAGLRLHLLSTGWWISWISQETLNQDQVLQSHRSLGWLKCWLSPSWGEIGAFYQLNWGPALPSSFSSVLTDIFRATGQTGKCWGRRGEDDHDTPPSPPPAWPSPVTVTDTTISNYLIAIPGAILTTRWTVQSTARNWRTK